MRKSTYLIIALLIAFNINAGVKEDPKRESTISAQVVDKESGEVLTGVCIMINGEKSNTYTDFEGFFELSLSEEVESIELSFISYNNKSVSIGQLLDSADARIELDPR